MSMRFLDHISATLDEIENNGLLKRERPIISPQAGRITVELPDQRERQVIHLCANNYLGLANHPKLIEAAKQAMDDHGYGMASVRFYTKTAPTSPVSSSRWCP